MLGLMDNWWWGRKRRLLGLLGGLGQGIDWGPQFHPVMVDKAHPVVDGLPGLLISIQVSLLALGRNPPQLFWGRRLDPILPLYLVE